MKNRVFIHVHRTAGSSIWHTLAHLATRRGVGICDLYHESKLKWGTPVRANDILQTLRQKVRGIPCMFHHHTTEPICDFLDDDDTVYATVVRDPVDRFVSWVNHLRAFLCSSATAAVYVGYYVGLAGAEFYQHARRPESRTEELLEIAACKPYFTNYYTTLFGSLFGGAGESCPQRSMSADRIRHLAETTRRRLAVIGSFGDLQSAFSAIVDAFQIGGSNDRLQTFMNRAQGKPSLSTADRQRYMRALESEYAFLEELRMLSPARLRRSA